MKPQAHLRQSKEIEIFQPAAKTLGDSLQNLFALLLLSGSKEQHQRHNDDADDEESEDRPGSAHVYLSH
jgi:hypothetical protein